MGEQGGYVYAIGIEGTTGERGGRMQAVEQLVAISIGISVFGVVVLGGVLAYVARQVRHVADIQRAIFLQLRHDHTDLTRELAEIKRLME
jgi:hypothetical protein